MKLSKAVETLYKVFAQIYNISPEQLSEPGNAIRVVEGLTEENNLYYTVPQKKALISVSPEDVSRHGMEFFEGCSLEQLAEVFTGWELEERHPHLVYEPQTPPSFEHPQGYEVRSIDPADHGPVTEFLAQNSESDVDDAMIDVDDPDEAIRMAFYQGNPVGYAGYRVWEHGLSDVGILIHPDHRGKGLGRSLVADVTGVCMARGRVPLWRTWDGNPGSLKIALSCGYSLQWRTDVYRWKPGR